MSLTCFYRNLFSIYVLIMLKPPLMVNNKTREKGRKGENERERERERWRGSKLVVSQFFHRRCVQHHVLANKVGSECFVASDINYTNPNTSYIKLGSDERQNSNLQKGVDCKFGAD